MEKEKIIRNHSAGKAEGNYSSSAGIRDGSGRYALHAMHDKLRAQPGKQAGCHSGEQQQGQIAQAAPGVKAQAEEEQDGIFPRAAPDAR